MATSKRERQKAARREKIERQQRQYQRKRNVRRGIIVAIVAVLVVGTAALLFSGNKKPKAVATTTSTTIATTTTTTIPKTFPAVKDPSPAGTFGKAPTVIVPPGKPPTTMEVTNLINGTGTVAETGESLEVRYVLATYSSGKVIQSDWTSTPFTFTLGTGVITGWDEGIPGMRVGGRRELVIPPALGYRDEDPGGGIAANDTLVFVVDLLKVTPAT
jgi:peptidylprolyl isomerase